MHVDLVTQLTRHALFDPLALTHRDPRRDHTPRGCFVRVRPVDRPEPREHALELRDHGIALSDLWPGTTVHVQTEDAFDLLHHLGGWRIAVDGPGDPSARILLETQAHLDPIPICQEGEVQMPSAPATLEGRLMPAADEVSVLLERVIPARNDVERLEPGLHQVKSRPPSDRQREFSYASLIRFARGPFWLGSISKVTRSPPASESKFTAESSPVRWKKYSLPSSAAINPNPRSETNFLMVPVGIPSLPFSKTYVANARPFREVHDRGAHRPPSLATDLHYHRISGFRRSKSEQADPHKSGHRAGNLHRRGVPFAELPHSPNRHPDHGGFTHRSDHRERGEAQSPQHQQIASPHHHADTRCPGWSEVGARDWSGCLKSRGDPHRDGQAGRNQHDQH